MHYKWVHYWRKITTPILLIQVGRHAQITNNLSPVIAEEIQRILLE